MAFGNTNAKIPEPKKLAGLDADSLNTNQEAIAVPWMAGRRQLPLIWITNAYNQVDVPITKKVGKERQTVGTNQYVDLAGLLCCRSRPLDHLFKHVVKKETLWNNSAGLARDGDPYEPVIIADFATTRFYWGRWDQPIDTLVLTPIGPRPTDPGFDDRDFATWPEGDFTVRHPIAIGHYDHQPAYRPDSYLSAKRVKCDGGSVPPWLVEVGGGIAWFGGATLASDDRGVNSAGTLYDWLTDPVQGKGKPESALVFSSFDALRLKIDGERLSPLITQQQDLKTCIAQLCEYHDLWLRMAGAKIEVGAWQRGNINVNALPVIDDNDLAGEPDLTPANWDDCYTKVTVKFCDRKLDFKEVNTEPYYNHHVLRAIGEPREITLDRRWITDEDLANRYCAEWAVIHGRPVVKGTVPVKRERAKAKGIHRPGTLFKLNWATRDLSIVMRVPRVVWPAAADGVAKLTVASERGIWPALYIQPPAPKPGNFVVSVPVIPANRCRIFELPSGLKDSSAVQVAVLAQRPAPWVLGFRIHISLDTSTYALIGTQRTFATFGKIVNAAYPSSTANLDTTEGMQVEIFGVDELESQTDTERDNNTMLAICNGEIMSLGQAVPIGDFVYRCFQRRTLYGTVKATHAIGNPVFFIRRDELQRIENRNFIAGATRYFKLQPFTQASEHSLSGLPQITYAFSNAPAVNSIQNLTLTTDWEMTSQDVVSARIVATWDPVTDADVTRYEVGIKLSSEVTYRTRSNGASTSTRFEGLRPGLSYDVRVRPVSSRGEPGLWCLPETIVTNVLLMPNFGSVDNGTDKNTSQTFVTSFSLYMTAQPGYPAGSVIRWSTGADPVTASDPIAGGGVVATVAATGTYSARLFSGTRPGPQRTVTFSKVGAPAPTTTTNLFTSGSGSVAVPNGATKVVIEVSAKGGSGGHGVGEGDGGDGGDGGYCMRTIDLESTDWPLTIPYVVGSTGNSSAGPRALANWNVNMIAQAGGAGGTSPTAIGATGGASGGQINSPGGGGNGGVGGSAGGAGTPGGPGSVKFTWTF